MYRATMFARPLACLALLASIPCARVHAQQAPTIAWQAPTGCPTQADVEASVLRWLLQSPEPLDASALNITAQVFVQGERFVLDFDLQSPSGHARERLQTERCETLAEVVALKVALAADPTAMLSALDAVPRRTEHAVREKREVTLGARVSGGAAIGVLPAAAATAALTLWIELPSHLRLELAGNYSAAQTTAYALRSDLGAELALWSTAARACFAPKDADVQILVCAGAELGAMNGTGFGVEMAFTSSQLWAALSAGPALRVPLTGHLALVLEVASLFAVARPAYHMRNLPTLYRAPSAAVRALLGVELAID